MECAPIENHVTFRRTKNFRFLSLGHTLNPHDHDKKSVKIVVDSVLSNETLCFKDFKVVHLLLSINLKATKRLAIKSILFRS